MKLKIMTKTDFLEFMQRVRSSLDVDKDLVSSYLKDYIANAKDLAVLDKSHLDWEVTHMMNSYNELKRDMGRVISTLEGKGFNAGTKI